MTPYYQDDACTIYHGDSAEVLPHLGMFDLLLTDPPYGIGEAAGKNKSRSTSSIPATDYGDLDWDDRRIAESLLSEIRLHAKKQIIFGGNYYADLLPPSKCWLVWDKDNTGDFADCELAWANMDMAVRRLKYRWNGMLQQKMGQHKETRYHPTQKPLDLMTWCIGLARDCSTILDPFMGSGTTLRSAKDLNLKAVGIDREEKYCEIAAKRLRQEVLPLGRVS